MRRDTRPRGNWVPGRESFECPVQEFEVYPGGHAELLQQDRHLGQGWPWEGKSVVPGKGGKSMSIRVSARAGSPAPQSNSSTSQDGKNSWESLCNKYSNGQGSSPARTGRKSRSWLRATWEVSERELDLHSEPAASSVIQEDPALLGGPEQDLSMEPGGSQPSQACRLTVISGCAMEGIPTSHLCLGRSGFGASSGVHFRNPLPGRI